MLGGIQYPTNTLLIRYLFYMRCSSFSFIWSVHLPFSKRVSMATAVAVSIFTANQAIINMAQFMLADRVACRAVVPLGNPFSVTTQPLAFANLVPIKKTMPNRNAATRI